MKETLLPATNKRNSGEILHCTLIYMGCVDKKDNIFTYKKEIVFVPEKSNFNTIKSCNRRSMHTKSRWTFPIFHYNFLEILFF